MNDFVRMKMIQSIENLFWNKSNLLFFQIIAFRRVN